MIKQINKITIKCDKCTWEALIELEKVPKWQGVYCPECKESIIINSYDMAVINRIIEALKDGWLKPATKDTKVIDRIDTRMKAIITITR